MQNYYDDFKLIDENKLSDISKAYADKLEKVKIFSSFENFEEKLSKMFDNLKICGHLINNLLLEAKNKENLQIFLEIKNNIEEFEKKLNILYEKENCDNKLEISNEFSSNEKAFVDEFISFLQNLFVFLGFETNIKVKTSLENMFVEGLNLLKKLNNIKVSKLKIFSLFKKRN